MARFAQLSPGDPAPWFKQRTFNNSAYKFDTVGGRFSLLCFYGSAADEAARRRIDAIAAHRHLFTSEPNVLFGVSNDSGDEAEGRIRDHVPGIRHFLDFDGSVAKLYGALDVEAERTIGAKVRRRWVLVSPTLRVMKVFPFADDASEIQEVMDCVLRLPPPDRVLGEVLQAPIMVVPDVFEPELCERLIALYEAHGGRSSGFMRQVDGKTVYMSDPRHKRRRDHMIEDEDILAAVRTRFQRRVVPEILKVHQFKVTRMERYLVACYDAAEGGHFNAHRDNTTSGTAHRRFAASVNLNDAFEGGMVSFPEYGPRGFKPPIGAAVVFSCSLLHQVSEVTSGRRYAFLPFLYDDAAARIRQQNLETLDLSNKEQEIAQATAGTAAAEEA